MSQWKRKNSYVSRCVPPPRVVGTFVPYEAATRLRAPSPEKYPGQREAFLIGAHHPFGRAMRKAVKP